MHNFSGEQVVVACSPFSTKEIERQIMKNAPYQCESFTTPMHADKMLRGFSGEHKDYHMAFYQGFSHVNVESYPCQGVIVYYVPTGTCYSWSWENREFAWRWARERAAHIKGIQANGNFYASGGR